MNQIVNLIQLHQFTDDDHPFGNAQGKKTFRQLIDYIDSNHSINIFGISLKGIEATDGSFPRESVLAVAKQYRGDKGFYLEDVKGRDLVDNWAYAANAKDQPIVIWSNNSFEVIGPKISSSNLSLVNYILENGSVTAAKIAAVQGITVPNASTKLKKLVTQGYIMRSDDVAESGGVEFLYHRIK